MAVKKIAAPVNKVAAKKPAPKAAAPVIKRVKSWSISAYNDYEECNYAFQLGRLQKLNTGPKPPAFARGEEIHSIAEFYIKGKGRALPAELNKFPELFKKLRKQYDTNSAKAPIRVEEMWGFDTSWAKCAWDDWDKCWLRVKADCAYFEGSVLHMPDWKTGRHRDDMAEKYMLQLEVSAMACLILYPNAEIVKPTLHYLDHGTTYAGPGDPVSYTPDDLPRLKATWEKRTKKMFADTVFKPNPGRKCSNCFFRRSNAPNGGGQCRF